MIEHKQEPGAKGTLITYRSDIKVLDCTVRDGGLINDHFWDDKFVRSVYDACVESGVDYMELGYKNSAKILAPAKFGPWKHCSEDDMRRIVDDNPTEMKLSAILDAEKADYHTDILPKSESVLDMIRVATYIHQLPTAVDMIKDAHDKGYETTLNLMALSKVNDRDLEEALQVLAETPVDVVYVVDSFGALYPEQIRDYVLAYLEVFQKAGKQVGIHAHNNQQLAFGNTIEALVLGATFLDATINGIGRGPGNCPLELLIGFLRNPKFHLRPILKCITETLVPLQPDMEWGCMVPYIITGQLNEHPRQAIKMRAGDTPDDYVGFYDQITSDV